MAMKGNQRVREVTVTNVKGNKRIRLRYVPEDGLQVAGKSGMGKTSLLKALQLALNVRGCDETRPIRGDADRGEVIVKTDDYIITRQFYYGVLKGVEGVLKTTLKVEAVEGGKYSQTDIDELLSDLTFDPSEFVAWDGARQLEAFRKLGGAEWSQALTDLQAKVKSMEGHQKTSNKAVKDMGNVRDNEPPKVEVSDPAQLATNLEVAKLWRAVDIAEAEIIRLELEAPEQVKDINILDLYRERDEIQEHNKGVEEREEALKKAAEKAIEQRAIVAELERKLQSARDQLAMYEDECDQLPNAGTRKPLDEVRAELDAAAETNQKAETYKEHQREVILAKQSRDQYLIEARKFNQVKPADPKQAVLDAQAAMESAKGNRAGIDRRVRWEAKLEALEEAESTRDMVVADLKASREAVKAHLLEADFSIEGVEIRDEGLWVMSRTQGEMVPIKEAAEGEQFGVAADIAIAMNPKLRVMFVQRAESLDDDIWADLEAKCAAANPRFQLWSAIVDSRGREVPCDCLSSESGEPDPGCAICHGEGVLRVFGHGNALVFEVPGELEYDGSGKGGESDGGSGDGEGEPVLGAVIDAEFAEEEVEPEPTPRGVTGTLGLPKMGD